MGVLTVRGLTRLLDRSAPFVLELDPAPDPVTVFRAVSGLPHAVFFDSAMRHPTLGRYSYVAADPFDWFTAPADGMAVLPGLDRRVRGWTAPPVEGLPPWQGGAAGVIGYEVGRSLETLPRPQWDEFGFPALAVGIYDAVVAFDHAVGRAWIVSHGAPARGEAARRRAEQRAAALADRLATASEAVERPAAKSPLLRSDLAPSFDAGGVLSDFSRDSYLAAVRRAIELMREGDAYQINLSQRLMIPNRGDPIAAYCRLRTQNPAPFAGYLDAGPWRLASASPERFVRVDGGRVETRPIKGTRRRGVTPAEDDRLGAELAASEKDRAENVMIVDLLRNDLSRVCEDDSIEVPTLFGLERYAHVQHLVSVVTGTVRADRGVVDVLAATLPGGSITGAPKVRAQQRIAELEPTARGAYCGNLFWIGFPEFGGRQAMDSSVLIRTLTHARGWVQAPVGGGVVVQSDPEREYDETWEKAAGLIDAVRE